MARPPRGGPQGKTARRRAPPGPPAGGPQGGDVTVALAYPNTPAVGMGSLGYRIVLRLLGEVDGVLPLRTFLPEEGRRGALLTHDHPREVIRADWLAFSVSWENDYLNLLAMVEAAGLPLSSRERAEGHPLVVVGGIAPSLNPAPLADVADVVVIGEAEEALPRLLAAYREGRDARLPREELLLSLTREPGVWVPRFYRETYREDGLLASVETLADVPARVRRLWVPDLDAYPPDSPVEAADAEFGDMVLVETGRGCGRGCRFCAAGFFYRPVRHRSYEVLASAVDRRRGEGKRIGLLGASVFDHPAMGRLAAHLKETACPFSVSSLRADAVSVPALEAMAAGGLRTVTIAPETGTERLRRVIRKDITDEQVFAAATAIAAAGIPNLKLYFMIGLPGETRSDVEGIVDLVRGIRHHVLAAARGRGSTGNITASVSSFVPKAWTPFQWHPMEELETLRRKHKWLSGNLSRVPNVRAVHDLPRWAFVQALLSRGDRRVGQVLRLTLAEGGDWKRALRHAPVNPEFHVYRPRGADEAFPWEVIDTGLDRGHLWREYVAALQAGGAGGSGAGRPGVSP